MPPAGWSIHDIKTGAVRAAMNLLESVGRSEGLQQRLFDGWVNAMATVAECGIAETSRSGF